MSDIKNDEKLRVLQERLAQIKQKQDTPQSHFKKMDDVIKTPSYNDEAPKKEKNPMNLLWIKKGLIIASVTYGIFYGYTNIDYNSLVLKYSQEENSIELAQIELEYNLNLEGSNIAIISTTASIIEEASAKAIVNDLKVKGYKCDYIYLPENSNLKDEVYQVFIGPYENEEETNQWANNLEAEYKIVTL